MKKIKEQGRFRPRTGDYFLSVEYLKDLRKKNAIVFPSPYWGLFFIGIFFHEFTTTTPSSSFRPRTGDYFLSQKVNIGHYIGGLYLFPSPYWGLFFIKRRNDTHGNRFCA